MTKTANEVKNTDATTTNNGSNGSTNQFNADSKTKPKIVTLKCNRYGGHDIDFGTYKKTVYFQSTIDIDMSKPAELNFLISVIKEINVPRGRRNSYTESEKHYGGGNRQKVVYIWEIIKGEDLIPANLRKIKYRPNKIILDSEIEDILRICPSYKEWINEKDKYNVMKKIFK